MIETLLQSPIGPLLGPLCFLALWLFVSALLAHFSGWSSLATEFRATEPTIGDRFYFVSGSMGARGIPVNYSNCLTLTIGERGVRLAILLPWRFGSPPLFIPWAMIESVTAKRFLFWRYVQIRFRDRRPRLSLHGRAGRCVLETYDQRMAMQTRLKRSPWTI